jgi:glycosyltransferase involved in cell wall biosynthesis|tara:strand:+ start:283 stop:1017 length:735 start_codon:yes stop_codon:yes gene_type:complete
MKIVIIIPCYNEADRLDTNKFIDYLSKNTHLHFIFIDDGSTDNTNLIIKQIILKFNSLASLLINETNKGKAESVRLGVIESYKMNPDFIGFLDADLAAPIGEIDNLLKIIKKDKTKEVVFASRIQLIGSEIKRNYFRHFFGRVFATVVSNILNLPVYDTQCGAKIFSRKICDDIFYEQFISPWLFDVELFARLLNVYGIERTIQMSYEHPVCKWVDIDGSKVKPIYFLKAPFELLKIVRHYKLR